MTIKWEITQDGLPKSITSQGAVLLQRTDANIGQQVSMLFSNGEEFLDAFHAMQSHFSNCQSSHDASVKEWDASQVTCPHYMHNNKMCSHPDRVQDMLCHKQNCPDLWGGTKR